jgi:hypothetical protein
MPTSLEELQKKKPLKSTSKYLSKKIKKDMANKKVKKIHPLQHRLFNRLQLMGYSNEQILDVVLIESERKRAKTYMRKGALMMFPKQLLYFYQIEQLYHMAMSEMTLNEFLYDYLKFGNTSYKTETEFNRRMAKLLYEPQTRVSKHLKDVRIPTEIRKEVRAAYENFKSKDPDARRKQSYL